MNVDMLTLQLRRNMGMRDSRVEFEHAARMWRDAALCLACVVALMVVAIVGMLAA